MRLRCGKIKKREVRRPVRRYIRIMVNPRNNNGDQPSNSVGTGTISATVIEPIASTASATVTPPKMVVPMMLPEGKVYPLIPQSHLVTPRPIVASDYKLFAIKITMPVPWHKQPFGMPTMVMESLQNNPLTFVDNATNGYSSIMEYGSAIGNHGRNMPLSIRMGFGSQAMPALTTNYVMEMRQQMD